jgi:hypothetical protein
MTGTLMLLVCATTLAADPATTLAERIDARLGERFRTEKRTPAAPASDAAFCRRLYLDLVGRIPSVAEARTFLDDKRPDKRTRLIDDLLSRPGHAQQMAQVWRTMLIPQASANLQLQHLGVSLEAWLRQRFRDAVPLDSITRELLTTPLDYHDRSAEGVPNLVSGLSPIGFYQANDLKAETTAASVSRIFLGLKLECAQCHNHPFDSWTQKQFWQTAAFFASVNPQEPDKPRLAALELNQRRQLRINDTKEQAEAQFLDGQVPDWKTDADPRHAFAAWLTRPDNPYFARVMANRLWAQMFGVGIVDPVDDWGEHNQPSHPELLDDLGKALVAAGFDSRVVLRGIARSAAYQRSSTIIGPAGISGRSFDHMNVKGLSAEQLFDSVALATGYREQVPLAARGAFGLAKDSPRGQIMGRFGGGSQRIDMQTSILQALALMNGDWISRQTDPDRGELLRAVADAPFLTTERKIETLFLATVSRRPSADENRRFAAHVDRGGVSNDPRKALADVLWALLNSEEFLLNR